MMLSMLPTDTGDAPLAWLVGTVVIAAVSAFLLAVLIGLLIRRLCRRWPLAVEATRRGRIPFRLLLVLIAVRQVVASTTVLGDWQDTLVTVLQLAILAVCGWILAVVAFVAEELTLARFPIDVADNRRARRVRTQVSLLRRLSVAAIITLVVAAMLLTLPGARQAGATILASAGVLGIVAGLAAQSSLSNLFAGLQLAFTDAIRVDDVVVVEKEWGRIEEITLTYVVVHVWDDRRLILPSTYFTTTPFQNWTRKESAVLGAIDLDVDWRVPLDELRIELDRALRGLGALGRTGRDSAGHGCRRQFRPSSRAGLRGRRTHRLRPAMRDPGGAGQLPAALSRRGAAAGQGRAGPAVHSHPGQECSGHRSVGLGSAVLHLRVRVDPYARPVHR